DGVVLTNSTVALGAAAAEAASRGNEAVAGAGDPGLGEPGQRDSGQGNSGEGERQVPRSLQLSDKNALAMAVEMAQVARGPQVIDGVQELLGPMPQGEWEAPPDKAIVLPIFLAGARDATGFLVIGASPYRPVDERYLNFCTLIADQLTTSFATIHVLEVERGRSEALAEIDKAKTLFFSNISHEFRTPLTLLLGPIEDLLNHPTAIESNNPAAIESNKYRIGVAYRNALRMQKLVNTLLEFSRIEAGRLEGRFRRVDIGVFTIDLASTFRSAVEKAGMQLHTTKGPIPDEVYVDPELWERIILNLISNAFKYSHEGSITVDVRQLGSRIRVSVTDTGVGIAGDQINKIFDRFHRVENSGGRSLEGTGIGLAMVKELVRLHQGTIEVTSVVGEGSTFTVTIPTGSAHLPPDRIVHMPMAGIRARQSDAFVMEAMKWVPVDGGEDVAPAGDWENGGLGGSQLGVAGGQADAAGGQADVAGGSQAGGGKGDVAGGVRAWGDDTGAGDSKKYTVLLADDNADMREYVKRLLAPQFRVITARDGEEALEKMRMWRPDLLLSDVMMPRLDGFSLLQAIRDSPELQQTPVILLSARAGEEAKIEGLEAGADDYLVKPFGGRELLARVESNIRIANERAAALKEYTDKLEQTVRRRTQELRRLNISLEQSNEDLQQFAHVASHDLKEPVRKIRTFSGRLLEEYGKLLPEEAKAFLAKIQHATQRMSMMIEGVLNYSTINGNGQPISSIDLDAVFDNIESDLELAIAEAGTEIRREKLPQLEGAPVLIYQLFYNLVNNALKFSSGVGKPLITISSRVTEAAGKRIAEVTIRDNGIGFEQDQSSRIFEAFARLNSKDRFEGTGLGLALCKKIAERHGGTITGTGVRDEGAVFVVRLPLVQKERSI
ncbi:MAG TPA: ATP-binding protein, partial [Puia sp.]|nr:ATP-binding protein [Puia sp.]